MKTAKLLLILMFLLIGAYNSTNAVFAGSANPDPVEITQPNGVVFIAMPFGDEWYSGYEHNGYTILLDEATNYYVYAEQARTGALQPTSLRVAIDPPDGLVQHVRDRIELSNMPIGTMPDMPSSVWPGVSGSQPVLLLLVDFTPSTSIGTTAAQWSAAFFDNTAGAKSVKNFYEEASYGIFTVDPATETQGTANDGVIEVTLGYAHPNTYPTGDSNRQIVRNALIAADSYIDYSTFDTNSNNKIDVTELHIITIVRGYETSFGGTASACTPRVWGHRWSLFGAVSGPTLDSVKLASYSDGGGYMQFGEWHDTNTGGCPGSSQGNMATIGIMAHELGHDINWPDLYDTDGTSAGVGYWSVMASGSWGRASGEPSGTTPTHPDPFSKWYQGWVTPVDVATSMTSVAIPNSAQNASIYRLLENLNGVDWEFGSASGTGEYFLVENRQQVGFDAGLFRIDANAKGCIIWHIDETRVSSNKNNDDETRKHVDVEEADGVQDMDANTNRGDTGDPWPGATSNTTFSDSSTPNSKLYDSSASGVTVTNISVAGTGCTVDFLATYDYGDLLDSNNAGTYPTDSDNSNGSPARHLIDNTNYLGTAIDGDFRGLSDVNALGDDNAGSDDEDGVTFMSGLGHATGWSDGTVASGNGGSLQLQITGSGVPQVFVDFNENGTLTEATLRNAGGTALAGSQSGLLQVYFDVPIGTFNGVGPNRKIAVRVRLSTAGGLGASGTAPDGEVEDYFFELSPTVIALREMSTTSNSILPVLAGILAVISLFVIGYALNFQEQSSNLICNDELLAI